MEPIITSTANPLVKSLIALSKPQERKSTGLFLIEGTREFEKAVAHGYDMEKVFLCEEVYSGSGKELLKKYKGRIVPVGIKVFRQLAYREDSGGIIATSKMKKHSIGDIKLKSNPLVVILENVEKPGNIGGILRTADAAGVDALLICDTQTDLYNPNVVRSSLGTLFTMQIALCNTNEAITWLKKSGITIFASSPDAKNYYYDHLYTGSTALMMGSEAQGMSDRWFTEADHLIRIPMKGIVDSLNVSVSAAVLIYEALRQREVKEL